MDLKVWWIPQVPGKPFEVPVPDAVTGAYLVKALADYDAFQFEQNIKPDYCNAGGLMMRDGDDWEDWESDEIDYLDDLIALEHRS